MHKIPDPVKPVYTTGPAPLSFTELYSPRERRQLGKIEKSFWRTRDRVEFCFWEDRAANLVFITCRNIESGSIYRTIFLNAEKLYFELEAKVRGNRELLVRKKDKKITDDALLTKSIADYLNLRLNIKQEPLPWPAFQPIGAEVTASETSTTVGQTSTMATTLEASLNVDTAAVSIAVGSATHMERMCTFDRLAGDDCDFLEIPCPSSYIDSEVPYAKFRPDSEEKVATVITESAAISPDLTKSPISTVTTADVNPVHNGIVLTTTKKDASAPKKAGTVVAGTPITTTTIASPVISHGAGGEVINQNVVSKVSKKPAASSAAVPTAGTLKATTKKIAPGG